VTARRWLAVAGAGLLLAQAAPALTGLRGVRRAVTPRLAGLGHPGHIALTFDDGPDPTSTPWFLSALDRLGVRATFFLLGAMLERAPALGRDIVAAGHEVAIHGWDHANLLVRAPARTLGDLTRARQLIESVTGHRPRYFRPAYGVLTTGALLAARRLELTPVLWTCWGKDWRQQSTSDSVRRRLRAQLGPGATVLLHDSDCTSAPGSWHSALAALPQLIDDCGRSGWKVGPLREHFHQPP
jgi:peptidoglycan/xylan/chitin deacetylase (PgdA/CDA1 family)